MALDEALLRRARRTGELVLRVYGWARPTLSLGRNQTARGLYEPARLAEHAVDVVRRPTGGRAVLHWREVTYSVTAPVAVLAPADGSVRAAHARINRLLADALARLGVTVHEARPAGRAPVPDGAPCFEVPTGGELVADLGAGVAKLVASAQWQEEGALLQHGSILLDDDQTRIAGLAARPLPAIPRPATLAALLGRAPAPDRVVAALFAAARAVEDPAATPLGDDPDLALDAHRLRARYLDPAWTWRR